MHSHRSQRAPEAVASLPLEEPHGDTVPLFAAIAGRRVTQRVTKIRPQGYHVVWVLTTRADHTLHPRSRRFGSIWPSTDAMGSSPRRGARSRIGKARLPRRSGPPRSVGHWPLKGGAMTLRQRLAAELECFSLRAHHRAPLRLPVAPKAPP